MIYEIVTSLVAVMLRLEWTRAWYIDVVRLVFAKHSQLSADLFKVEAYQATVSAVIREILELQSFYGTFSRHLTNESSMSYK